MSGGCCSRTAAGPCRLLEVGCLKRRALLAIQFCITRNRAGVDRDESRQRILSDPAPSSALAPFRVRNYRFQWPADLLTSWAFEMETLILGWYVLVETGSVLLLTLFASLTYIGTLIAPMFGVVGDRIGHRDLLAMMRAAYAVLAATLMTLALTGHLSPLYVLVIVAVMGLVRPSDLGVRGALVATIMPSGQLIGAISLSRTTMDTARIAGALSGAGLFAALGMGPAYMAIIGLYVVSTLLTLCVVAPSKPHPIDEGADGTLGRSPMRDLKQGVAYVWTTPRMRAAMWIAFLANLTAYPLSNGLLPCVAGAIVCLMLAGFSQSLCMISIAVILMRTSSAHFRGRVMGVRMLVIYGLPLGLLAAGSLIDEIGFAATGTLYAMAGVALMMAIVLHWRADLWHVHAPANAK